RPTVIACSSSRPPRPSLNNGTRSVRRRQRPDSREIPCDQDHTDRRRLPHYAGHAPAGAGRCGLPRDPGRGRHRRPRDPVRRRRRRGHHRHQHAPPRRLRLYRGHARQARAPGHSGAGVDHRKRRGQEAAGPRRRRHRLDRQAVRPGQADRRRTACGGLMMSDDPFEAIKVTFFQECDELLGDLEAGLLAIEAGEADDETVNAVFRAVHSVKGGAGAFGLDDLVRFAHVFETLLDEIRSGRKPCDETTVKTLLRAADLLADHIAAARGQGAPVDEVRSSSLVVELEQLTHGEAAASPETAGPTEPAPPEPDEFGFRPIAFDLSALDAPVGTVETVARRWRVVFRPHARMYANANESGLLLRELARLGPVEVTLDHSTLPALGDLVAEESHLTWTIDIEASAGEAAIRELFD